MNNLNSQVKSQASIYNDLHSLDRIRQQAKGDQRAAIKAAAKEFEAFFMNMMLKSMRQASEVIGDDSMFGSQQEKMFVGMLDEQLSVDLSQKGNLGIAELLTRDLLSENIPVNSNRVNFKSKEVDNSSFIKTINKINERMTKPLEFNDNNNDNINLDRADTNNPSLSLNQAQLAGIRNDNHLEKIAAVSVVNLAATDGIEISTNSDIQQPVLAEKKSLFDNAEAFIDSLLPKARKIAQNLGVDPRLLVAQAALETGWGKYIMHDQSGTPSYNLFGIKQGANWNGDSIKANTLEVEQGTIVKRQENFRMYESFEQSFEDYVNFVKSNPRYQQAVDAVDNAKQYIKALQDSGYATDPNYANKIINIYESGIASKALLK
jgi:peptidoglycan hydrolase FlgJ